MSPQLRNNTTAHCCSLDTGLLNATTTLVCILSDEEFNPTLAVLDFLLCSQLSNATGSHARARSRTAAALSGLADLLGLEFCTIPAVPILEEVLAAFVCGTSVSTAD